MYVLYIHGISMIYFLIIDESTWWSGCIFGICLFTYHIHVYPWYIHGKYITYVWYIPSILSPHPYGRYIPCKTFMGIFGIGLYTYHIHVYAWYIHCMFMVYIWYIPSILCPDTYGWYIQCNKIMDLFRTFFIMIYL